MHEMVASWTCTLHQELPNALEILHPRDGSPQHCLLLLPTSLANRPSWNSSEPTGVHKMVIPIGFHTSSPTLQYPLGSHLLCSMFGSCQCVISSNNLYRLLRPIGYCRFELNVWVWSPFLGRHPMSPKTGLFLTFWKVNRRKSRRSGCLKKNTVLVKINGKNSKNCLSLSNCVISNPLERKFFGYCVL